MRRSVVRSSSSRTAARTTVSVGNWSGDPVPWPSNGCSAACTTWAMTLTTAGRCCGAAGARVAGAIGASIILGAMKCLAGASAAVAVPSGCDCSPAGRVNSRVAAVDDTSRSSEVREKVKARGITDRRVDTLLPAESRCAAFRPESSFWADRGSASRFSVSFPPPGGSSPMSSPTRTSLSTVDPSESPPVDDAFVTGGFLVDECLDFHENLGPDDDVCVDDDEPLGL